MSEPIQEDPDTTKTLVYTGIAGLGFLLASFLGHIVITALWFMGWALLLLVLASAGWRYVEGEWPQWVHIVCERLRGLASRWPFAWRP